MTVSPVATERIRLMVVKEVTVLLEEKVQIPFSDMVEMTT